MKIRVGKDPVKMEEQEFLREAVKEIQKEVKAQGRELKFDVSTREEVTRKKANEKVGD